MSNYNDIILTDSAAKRVTQITTDSSNNNYKKTLKITINTGGCAGLRYKYEFIDKPDVEDILIKNGDASVAVDDFSAQLLKGATIDFVETSDCGTASFKITNPTTCNSCSCGSSFAV